MGLLLSGKNPAAYKTAERSTFTATAGQTTFTVSVGYNVGDIDVFLNGLKLVEGDDFFATNGTTVVLASGANLGDSLSVVCYYNFLNSSSYTKAETDARYIQPNGSLPMTSYLRTPNYGISSYSDTANASIEANPGLGTQGSAIKVWGRSVSTNGGDIHYVADTRGAGATHRFYGWNGTSLTTLASIDSVGRFSYPQQPCFYAWSDIYSPTKNYTSEVVFSNSTTNGLTTVTNVGNNFSAVTGRFVAPIAGYYFFSGSFSRTAGNATLDIYKNGSSVGCRHLSYGADWQTVSATVIIPLAVSDYVELRFGGTNGTTTSGYRIHFTGRLEN